MIIFVTKIFFIIELKFVLNKHFICISNHQIIVFYCFVYWKLLFRCGTWIIPHLSSPLNPFISNPFIAHADWTSKVKSSWIIFLNGIMIEPIEGAACYRFDTHTWERESLKQLVFIRATKTRAPKWKRWNFTPLFMRQVSFRCSLSALWFWHLGPVQKQYYKCWRWYYYCIRLVSKWWREYRQRTMAKVPSKT